jgi:hypothetical protein
MAALRLARRDLTEATILDSRRARRRTLNCESGSRRARRRTLDREPAIVPRPRPVSPLLIVRPCPSFASPSLPHVLRLNGHGAWLHPFAEHTFLGLELGAGSRRDTEKSTMIDHTVFSARFAASIEWFSTSNPIGPWKSFPISAP